MRLEDEIEKTFSYDSKDGTFAFRDGMSRGRRVKPFCGALDGAGYARSSLMAKGKQVTILAHRAAWLLHYGQMPSGCIDHINGDVLDNRISNLRDVDLSTNQKNRGLSKTNGTGKTGVRFRKRFGRYYAEMTDRGQRIFIGSYRCVTAAVIARSVEESKRGFISRQ